MILKEASADFGQAKLSSINSNLERMFGKDWADLEIETISLELGLTFDELTIDKICLLKALKTVPGIFFSNLLFFVHAVEVINNHIADFEVFPHLTSLEVGLAIRVVEDLFGSQEGGMSPEVSRYVNFVLNEEGYSKVLGPFTKYGPFSLAEGQTEEDTKNKDLALKSYITANA